MNFDFSSFRKDLFTKYPATNGHCIKAAEIIPNDQLKRLTEKSLQENTKLNNSSKQKSTYALDGSVDVPLSYIYSHFDEIMKDVYSQKLELRSFITKSIMNERIQNDPEPPNYQTF